MSTSSPSTKRSLKPSPAVPSHPSAPQQQAPQQSPAFHLPSLHPLQPATPTVGPDQTVQLPSQTQIQAQPSTQPSASASAPAPAPAPAPFASLQNHRKRKSVSLNNVLKPPVVSTRNTEAHASSAVPLPRPADVDAGPQEPKPKKSRTNTPWTPAEELRLKHMRDAGNSWSEIAKTFPQRTEGSVKKHWYKDMHYAEFAEDESSALLSAIKEYESNKWKAIGQKVGKPAKACEAYAKEHFGGKY